MMSIPKQLEALIRLDEERQKVCESGASVLWRKVFVHYPPIRGVGVKT